MTLNFNVHVKPPISRYYCLLAHFNLILFTGKRAGSLIKFFLSFKFLFANEGRKAQLTRIIVIGVDFTCAYLYISFFFYLECVCYVPKLVKNATRLAIKLA